MKHKPIANTTRTSFNLENVLNELWKIESLTYYKKYDNNQSIEISYDNNKWKCILKELFITS